MTWEKFTKTENGKVLVAVLYSPGYGAGWSTWAPNKLSTQLIFDKRLVELKLKGHGTDAGKELLDQLFPDTYISLLGWSDVEVAWVAEEDRFIIQEYDGFETIRLEKDFQWLVA